MLRHTNIRGEEYLLEIVDILGCQVQQFPIRYLGLPLSTRSVPKASLYALVEQVANKLPPCKGSLMARSGRLIWIMSVLCSVPIYAMLAESLPNWARNEIDKICRKVLWAGADGSVKGQVHGGLEHLLQADGARGPGHQRPAAVRIRIANPMALAAEDRPGQGLEPITDQNMTPGSVILQSIDVRHRRQRRADPVIGRSVDTGGVGRGHCTLCLLPRPCLH
jgi:hypothetical protein